MSHKILSIRPSTGGVRKFAVVEGDPAVVADWCSGEMSCQSDQTWDLTVWRRIEGRGCVAKLEGGGQWANRGDQGVCIGTGATAEAALLDAWGRGDYRDYEGDPPQDFIAACRDHDCQVTSPDVE